MQNDFDMRETPLIEAQAESLLSNPADAVRRIEEATVAAMQTCQALWHQVQIARRIGFLFDEQLTTDLFGRLNSYLMEKNAVLSRLANVDLCSIDEDKILILTVIFHAEITLLNEVFEQMIEFKVKKNQR